MIKYIVSFFLVFLPVLSSETDLPPQQNQQDDEYLELYRATKGNHMILARGTVHTLKPNDDPSVLQNEMFKAPAFYSENHNTNAEEFAKQSESDLPGIEQITTKIKKRDGEPNWLELCKAKVMKDAHGNPNTLYECLANHPATKLLLSKMPQDTTLDALISSSSAYGIFYVWADAFLMQKMENQKNAYEKVLYDMFKNSGKATTVLETTEELLTFKRDFNQKEIESIIDNSIVAPNDFVDFLASLISTIEDAHSKLLYTYKKGWIAFFIKNFNPNSDFLHGRTFLWFNNYIKPEPFLAPWGSLFCMGAGHLHTLTFEDGTIKHGFLGKLEEDGWTLENLKSDGQWKPWTTASHEAWLKTQEADIAKLEVQNVNP